MRLIDRVMKAPAEMLGRDTAGRAHRLPGPGAHAAELESCALRYIIDRDASYQCGDLLRREPELLATDNPLLRAPAESFWLEWFEQEFAEGGAPGVNPRLAVLVKASRGGRQGMLWFFFERPAGDIGMSPLQVHFDLDEPIGMSANAKTTFRLTHRDLPHVDRLFRHVVVSIDDEWHRALSACSMADRRSFVSTNAASIWIALPLALCFSALLNDGSILSEGRSDLERLNAARGKRDRRPLLDHIEVSMRLGGAGSAPSTASGSSRAAPRLHYVRGHPVHRGGRTFWRTAHFRGDTQHPILSRTVTVRGAALQAVE